MARRFRDRVEAGDRLADRLREAGEADPDAIVLGLPRGGVVVAARVAGLLGAALDVLVARKVGAPGHREFGIGAVAEGGATVLWMVSDDNGPSLFQRTLLIKFRINLPPTPKTKRRPG